MDVDKASKLIEKIWNMQEQLKLVQNGMIEIEFAIADEVPDEK